MNNMLAKIFMDLLCIVGIVFLGGIFISILMNTMNEIKLNNAKRKAFKDMEKISIDTFKKHLEEEFKDIVKDKEK